MLGETAVAVAMPMRSTTPSPFLAIPSLVRAALDCSRDAVTVTDDMLDPPGPRYVYVNAAFERITGYSADEALGHTPRMLQGPATDRAQLRRLRECLSRGESFDGEVVNYRRDGTAFVMRWYIEPILTEGRLSHYIAVQRDVTHERRLEAITQSFNLAENVGYIFAGIRHELGNPINSIKAALTLLREELNPEERAHHGITLDRVMAEFQRIEFLLSTLRGFSAFERPEICSTELASFLAHVVGLVRADAAARGVAIVLGPFATRNVLVDPRLLQSVVLNLLTNAIDAAEGVADARITVDADEPHNGLVRLRVCDNGRGLTIAECEEAMKPFHTSKARGTGMGLPIARKLCASIHATLDLVPGVPRGVEAIVELEAAP